MASVCVRCGRVVRFQPDRASDGAPGGWYDRDAREPFECAATGEAHEVETTEENEMRAENVKVLAQPRIGKESTWFYYSWTWRGVARKSQQTAQDPDVLRELVSEELRALEDRARMLRSVLAQVLPAEVV